MPTQPTTSSSALRNLYFAVGILATFFYRAIIVFNHVSNTLVLVSWYVGTMGFIVYFAHRYQVSEKRAKLIRQHDLVKKVEAAKEFSAEDQAAMEYIVGTLVSTKEKWNYIFIFVTSGLALVIGVLLDFVL